jgi:hypothetical protein
MSTFLTLKSGACAIHTSKDLWQDLMDKNKIDKSILKMNRMK